MEFHASGHTRGSHVDVMACSETLCRQLKIAVTDADEKTHGDSIQKIVESKLGELFAKVGDDALTVASLADIEAKL